MAEACPDCWDGRPKWAGTMPTPPCLSCGGSGVRRESWYAARRTGVGSKVERLRGQPDGGFEHVTDVMAWLRERGLIEEVVEDGEPWTRGWGDPYCAVGGSRDDPWEKPPQLELA